MTDTNPSGQDKKILVVDDEPMVRQGLVALLSAQSFDVSFAPDGPSAIASVRSVVPDVILLDVMMPGMDGFEVCRRIKGDPASQHVPIIMLTALADPEFVARGIEAGADDFISKPASSVELRARLRSMLRIKGQHDALRELLDLRERMVQMVVHDMRSPLAAIDLISTVNLNSSPDEQLTADFLTVQSCVRDLERMAATMLLTSRLSRGALDLAETQFDLFHVADHIVATHQRIAGRKDVKIEFVCANRPTILADEGLIARTIDNLLANAVRHSPADGSVRLEIVSSGPHGGPMVVVSDNGPGVPEELKETIFRPFVTSALDQERIPNIGLGLAFCRMVAEAHGGDILLDDNSPSGSVFTLTLPADLLCI
ncbi:MAG: response regulator [Myxococcales bacterium]|nr:response regulator [Myxococcales bacterium]